VRTFENHEQPASRTVAEVPFTSVKQAAVVKNCTPPPNDSGNLVELAWIGPFRKSPAIAWNQRSPVGQNSLAMASAGIVNTTVFHGTVVQSQPKCQRIGWRQVEVPVVLMVGNGTTNSRGLGKELYRHQYRFSVNQSSHQVDDLRLVRKFVEIGTVFLHPPKIANSGSLTRRRISLVDNIPWRQGWNHALVVRIQLAFELQQLPSIEKILHSQESIFFESPFAVCKVHEFVSLENRTRPRARLLPSREPEDANEAFSSNVALQGGLKIIDKKQSPIAFYYSMSFSAHRTTPM
jgi:hypothetical protein